MSEERYVKRDAYQAKVGQTSVWIAKAGFWLFVAILVWNILDRTATKLELPAARPIEASPVHTLPPIVVTAKRDSLAGLYGCRKPEVRRD